MKLSVYLIEDDLDFAKVLLQLLTSSPLLEVAGHATLLADARIFLQHKSAEVFLIDINLPDGNGIDIIREIRMKYPQAKIMVLSALGHEKYIMLSLQAGASGYLLKSEIPDQIIQSIVSVANDGGALGRHASKLLINKLTQASTASSPPLPPQAFVTPAELEMLVTPHEARREDSVVLTPRELEILKVVQNGAATKRVAAIFGISIFTVNQHLRSIYAKLGARNKMEAVQEARQMGLL